MFEENFQNFNLDSALLKSKPSRLHSILPAPKREKAAPPAIALVSVNAADPMPSLTLPRQGSRPFFRRKKFIIAMVTIFVLAVPVIWGSGVISSLKKIFEGKSAFSLISSFGQFLSSDNRHLQGEESGEINILLLGIGGEGHEGALLTDTMMLVTIRKPQQDGEQLALSMLTIPRDLIVKLPAGLDYRKINSAYAYGEMGGKALGAKWAREAIEQVTGVSIPYYALIDFSGFKKVIDDLGGVDIEVERTFTDSQYPDYSHGYLPTLKFEKGLQHFDGEKALQYARSRHGTNNEGSDFARSRRQAKLLTAVKDRILKLNGASSISTITQLLANFADHFKTNFEPWEIKRAYDIARSVPNENILTLSLDPTTDLVCNEIELETGAYILTRCPGVTEDDVYTFVREKFTYAKLLRETPKLEIQNSTKLTGLAQRVKEGLETHYMETTVTNYPGKEILKDTMLYDLTGDKKPETLKYLQEQLNPLSSGSYPYLDKLAEPRPDFIVVLGTDATTFSTSTHTLISQ